MQNVGTVCGVDLQARPFNLDEQGVAWVKRTLDELSLEEKVGQVFCLHGELADRDKLQDILETYHPGGFRSRAECWCRR